MAANIFDLPVELGVEIVAGRIAHEARPNAISATVNTATSGGSTNDHEDSLISVCRTGCLGQTQVPKDKVETGQLFRIRWCLLLRLCSCKDKIRQDPHTSTSPRNATAPGAGHTVPALRELTVTLPTLKPAIAGVKRKALGFERTRKKLFVSFVSLV